MPVWLGLLSAEQLGSKWENLEIKQMEDNVAYYNMIYFQKSRSSHVVVL